MRVWCGHNRAAAEYVLDPGATFVTPEQVWAWSTEGVGPLSRRLHRWVREHATRDGDELRPIVVNNWEATSFSFDTERLLGLIDHTAKLGAELFLLDDGRVNEQKRHQSHPRKHRLGSRNQASAHSEQSAHIQRIPDPRVRSGGGQLLILSEMPRGPGAQGQPGRNQR